MSLIYNGCTGNVENQDFVLAGRVKHNHVPFAQSIGLAIEFGEGDASSKGKEEFSVICEALYYFDGHFNAFALGGVCIYGLPNFSTV